MVDVKVEVVLKSGGQTVRVFPRLTSPAMFEVKLDVEDEVEQLEELDFHIPSSGRSRSRCRRHSHEFFSVKACQAVKYIFV